jgi:hypothetical protein
MEKICFRRVVVVYCSIFLLLASCINRENFPTSINGHWYAVFGESKDMYGEIIFNDGKICSYSDELGMGFRVFKIKKDTILEIYYDDILDYTGIINYRDKDTFCAKQISKEFTFESICYHRIKSDLSEKKIFAQDTVEQNRYVREYMLRKEQWQLKK